MRVLGLVCFVAALAACGADERTAAPRDASRLNGYGLSVTVPEGWRGRIERAAVRAANFALPEPGSRVSLGGEQVLVQLFETDAGADAPPPDMSHFRPLAGRLRLEATDFRTPEGGEDDGATARRLFSLADRLFVQFVWSGAREPAPAALASVNDLLGSLGVEAGDFYPGTVEPPAFAPAPGWHVGASGVRPRLADGNFLVAWAATVAYSDAWNSVPYRTLERLPADGVLIWVGLTNSNRFPPSSAGSSEHPARTPPFRLADFDRRDSWEGQVASIPEYVLGGTLRGEYHADVHVYFGRPDPTSAMLDAAQARLDALRLPRWGPWETES